jgi:hypothetical protein
MDGSHYLAGFLIKHKHIAWSDKRCVQLHFIFHRSRTELGLQNERYYLNILTFTAFLIRLDLISSRFNCGHARAVIPNDRKDEFPTTRHTG